MEIMRIIILLLLKIITFGNSIYESSYMFTVCPATRTKLMITETWPPGPLTDLGPMVASDTKVSNQYTFV